MGLMGLYLSILAVISVFIFDVLNLVGLFQFPVVKDTKDVFSRPVDITTQQKVGKTKEVMLPAKYQCPKMFRLTVIYLFEYHIPEV